MINPREYALNLREYASFSDPELVSLCLVSLHDFFFVNLSGWSSNL